jgi:hypothetical protein
MAGTIGGPVSKCQQARKSLEYNKLSDFSGSFGRKLPTGLQRKRAVGFPTALQGLKPV